MKKGMFLLGVVGFAGAVWYLARAKNKDSKVVPDVSFTHQDLQNMESKIQDTPPSIFAKLRAFILPA